MIRLHNTLLVLTVILGSTDLCSTYRLNLPKVLLPHSRQSAAPTSYILSVVDSRGACFTWTSSKPEWISVQPLSTKGCSDKALVTSTNDDMADKHTAVVLASNKDLGVSLRCDVIVDTVKSIEIKSTTHKLFLDDSPVEFEVEGMNKEGDTFSSLEGFEFDWSVTDQSTNQVVRIVPFAESTYQCPESIKTLESADKKGYMVLVTGLNSGVARLEAKLVTNNKNTGISHLIDLLVVASLHLTPELLYVPNHAVMHFHLDVYKHSAFQRVTMPSAQYSLISSDDSIGSMFGATSMLAKQLGVVEVHVTDKNMAVPHSDYYLPKSIVHVVPPAVLTFRCEPLNSWVFQVGRQYKVEVVLADSKGHNMKITDNARFNTALPSTHFDIQFESTNSTSFIVTPKKIGEVQVNSKFIGVTDESGHVVESPEQPYGEQIIHIYDPIAIHPPIVVFPWHPSATMKHNMKATGGSGSFVWSVEDTTIALVHESSGLVTSGRMGHSIITVADVKQRAHTATAQVHVLPPTKLLFDDSKREAQTGSELRLALSLYANVNEKEMAVHDCRALPFQLTFEDASVFEIIEVASDTEDDSAPSGVSCRHINVRAVKPGDTRLTATYKHDGVSLTASVHISAFNALRPRVHDEDHVLMLALGTVIQYPLTDGVRPWVLDNQLFTFTAESVTSDLSISVTSTSERSIRVQCPLNVITSKVTITTVNRPSPSNPMPQSSVYVLRVCCSEVNRVWMRPHLAKMDGRECPIHPSTSSHPSESLAVYFGSDARLDVFGAGRCADDSAQTDRRFDSVASLKTSWKTSDISLMKLDDAYAIGHTQKVSGDVKVSMSADRYVDMSTCTHQTAGSHCTQSIKKSVSASVLLTLVDHISVSPVQMSLLLHTAYVSSIDVLGGSGYYAVVPNQKSTQLITAEPEARQIKVSALKLGECDLVVVDLCMPSPMVQTRLHVAELHSIQLHGAPMVEVNHDLQLNISLHDHLGRAFPVDITSMLPIDINVESGLLTHQHTPKTRVLNGSVPLRGVHVGHERVFASTWMGTKQLTSKPHQVQVYDALTLLPKYITLLVDTEFQVEVIGGPQQSSSVSFGVNDSSIATVNAEGMITSHKIGYAKVTCVSINAHSQHNTKDEVYVTVVDLKGIRVHAPTHHVYNGTQLPIHISGIGSNESPFSFGGRLDRLDFEWSIKGAGYSRRQLRTPFYTSNLQREESVNRFAVRLLANTVGTVTVSCTVTYKSPSGREYEFTDSVRIDVLPALYLTQPDVPLSTINTQHILMTPGSQLALQLNRDNGAVTYSVASLHDSLDASKPTPVVAHVDNDLGTLKAGQHTGQIVLTGQTTNKYRQVEVVAVAVEVVTVSYLMLNDDGLYELNSGVSTLPQGLSTQMHVTQHDSYGRRIHTNSDNLKFRLNRFDRVIMSQLNMSASMSLTQLGDSVLKVWDENLPESASDYIRVPVSQQLIADDYLPLVPGDIIKLNTPIQINGGYWHSSDPSSVRVLSASQGIVLVMRPDLVRLSLLTYDGKPTGISIEPTIASPTRMSVGTESWSSNHLNADPEHKSLVSVRVHGQRSRVGDHEHSVQPALSDFVALSESLTAPFTCHMTSTSKQHSVNNIWHAEAVYSHKHNSFACSVSVYPFETSIDRASDALDSVRLVVKMGQEHMLESSLDLPIIDVFGMEPLELTLDNRDHLKSTIRVQAPARVLDNLKASVSVPDLLHLSKMLPSQHITNARELQVSVRASDRRVFSAHQPELVVTFTAIVDGITVQKTVPCKLTVFADGRYANQYAVLDEMWLWMDRDTHNLFYGYAVIFFIIIVIAYLSWQLFTRAFLLLVSLVDAYKPNAQPMAASTPAPGAAGPRWRSLASPMSTQPKDNWHLSSSMSSSNDSYNQKPIHVDSILNRSTSPQNGYSRSGLSLLSHSPNSSGFRQ